MPVALAGRRTTERDVSEIMRRLKKKEPKAEPLPEHSFEKWVRDSRESPDLLMKVGSSYAHQGYHHRAELCFMQALEAGHADAQSALQYLPRDEYGVLLPGNTTAEYAPVVRNRNGAHPADRSRDSEPHGGGTAVSEIGKSRQSQTDLEHRMRTRRWSMVAQACPLKGCWHVG